MGGTSMSQRDATAASDPSAWMRIARSELAAADGPYDEDALPGVYCYLAQQAAEKAIKAVLVHRGIEPRKIHEIQALLVDVPDAPEGVTAAAILTQYIVEARYPADMPDATIRDRDEAVALARSVVEWAEQVIAPV